jgi:hypothetical protein
MWLNVEHLPAKSRKRPGYMMKAIGNATPRVSGKDHCAQIFHRDIRHRVQNLSRKQTANHVLMSRYSVAGSFS